MNIPDKLWAVANLLTGFASAHAMAYLIACANPVFRQNLRRSNSTKFYILVGIVLANLFYLGVIWWCHKRSVEFYYPLDAHAPTAEQFSRFSLSCTILRFSVLTFFGGISAILAFVVTD